MRGGGTKGAYEVGALGAMVEMLDPLEYAYDVVVGVSIGAYNAAALATFPRGQEKAAQAFLETVWLNNPIKEFWKDWGLWIFEGFWRSSLLDNSGMREMTQKLFEGQTFHRGVAI